LTCPLKKIQSACSNNNNNSRRTRSSSNSRQPGNSRWSKSRSASSHRGYRQLFMVRTAWTGIVLWRFIGVILFYFLVISISLLLYSFAFVPHSLLVSTYVYPNYCLMSSKLICMYQLYSYSIPPLHFTKVTISCLKSNTYHITFVVLFQILSKASSKFQVHN
jgi:hypothetical protein